MEKRFYNVDEVIKYLEEKKADFSDVDNPIASKNGMTGWVFDITVEYGDWKHSHGYLRYLMEEMGYTQLGESLIYVPELEGSDCYSSVHRFVWTPVYKMFAPKNVETLD